MSTHVIHLEENMKIWLRRIAIPVLAIMCGGIAAIFATAPVAADPPIAFGYCIQDSRCHLLDPDTDCRPPIFDTWCDVSMTGDCTTWSTGICEFPPFD